MPARGVTESRLTETSVNLAIKEESDVGIYQSVDWTEEEREKIKERRKIKKLEKKVEKEHGRRLQMENALKDSKIKVVKNVNVSNIKKTTPEEFSVNLNDFPEYGKSSNVQSKINSRLKVSKPLEHETETNPTHTITQPPVVLSYSDAAASTSNSRVDASTAKATNAPPDMNASKDTLPKSAKSKLQKVKSSHPSKFDLAALITVSIG